MTYEWTKDGVPLNGVTEPHLPILNLVEGESHDYTLVVSNAQGSITNGPVRVVAGQAATLGLTSGPNLSGSVAGTAGLSYRVEFQDGSPAGVDWQTLTNLTLSSGNGSFSDSPSTNRFYRALLVP